MLKPRDFVQTVQPFIHDPLKVLTMCGGLYICPKVAGLRVGPLVAYRGTYAPEKRYVGDLYANWAKVEKWPYLAFHLAAGLLSKLTQQVSLHGIDVFCGAPEGGKHLADKLAHWQSARYVYPETKNEKLGWGRHEVQAGDQVVIVEDVLNNFSTTDKMIRLIQEAGAVPVAIAAYMNRSEKVSKQYSASNGLLLPVCALVAEPYPEYRQDDLAVVQDVTSRNVVWDVKANWSQLMTVMEKYRE